MSDAEPMLGLDFAEWQEITDAYARQIAACGRDQPLATQQLRQLALDLERRRADFRARQPDLRRDNPLPRGA